MCKKVSAVLRPQVPTTIRRKQQCWNKWEIQRIGEHSERNGGENRSIGTKTKGHEVKLTRIKKDKFQNCRNITCRFTEIKFTVKQKYNILKKYNL